MHVVPYNILLDRDSKFTSRFLRAFHHAMRTNLSMSTKNNWEEHLTLTESAYNNSYHANITMAPYEALYERKCRTPLCWSKVDDKGIIRPEIIQETTKNIQEKMKKA